MACSDFPPPPFTSNILHRLESLSPPAQLHALPAAQHSVFHPSADYFLFKLKWHDATSQSPTFWPTLHLCPSLSGSFAHFPLFWRRRRSFQPGRLSLSNWVSATAVRHFSSVGRTKNQKRTSANDGGKSSAFWRKSLRIPLHSIFLFEHWNLNLNSDILQHQ